MQPLHMPQDRRAVLFRPTTLRSLLDRLYRLSGAFSALCLTIICLMIVCQVTGRLIDRAALTLGLAPPGLAIPSMAELAGFFLAAATFLGLGYTFRSNAHVRVSLLLHQLSSPLRKWLEVWCLLIALSVTGYFTWYAAILTLDSYSFGEVSLGMVPVPLWIPQSAMVAGLAVLALGIIDSLVRTLSGHTGFDDTTELD